MPIISAGEVVVKYLGVRCYTLIPRGIVQKNMFMIYILS